MRRLMRTSSPPLAENSWRYVDGSLRSDLPDDYGANADFEGRAMHSMPKGATAQGIDVSEHNGTINWQSVKDSGIDFAILRVGFAGDTNGGRLDNYFKRNVSECERLGIPYGVYLYSYARNEDEAQAEARLMLSALKGHSPTLPVYYDLEERETNADGSPKWTPFNDPSKLASIAKTFCGQIAAAGYKPGIYANVNWFKNYLTDPCFLSSGWSIWTAQYWYGGRYDECLGLTPDAPAKYDCWQYSARGSVPGVSGDVDVSYWFGEGLGDHWQETDEGKYYVSSNGQPYKGWKLISGVWYWFDPAKGGAMATGLHECNGSMYYFRSSGAMATGWVLDGGSWYYAGGSGALASGWVLDGGAWYWLPPRPGGGPGPPRGGAGASTRRRRRAPSPMRARRSPRRSTRSRRRAPSRSPWRRTSGNSTWSRCTRAGRWPWRPPWRGQTSTRRRRSASSPYKAARLTIRNIYLRPFPANDRPGPLQTSS